MMMTKGSDTDNGDGIDDDDKDNISNEDDNANKKRMNKTVDNNVTQINCSDPAITPYLWKP